jgi:hypothetical protein
MPTISVPIDSSMSDSAIMHPYREGREGRRPEIPVEKVSCHLWPR